ncbi:MAG: DNA internalization-related competence protein ComEC/Rec2 [bacterium]
MHTGFAQIDDLPPNHLTHYLDKDPNSIDFPITLIGRIIEPPEEFLRKTRLHLEVQKIILPERNVMTLGGVQLTWYNPTLRCQYYDTVQVTAQLRLPLDYKNPGGFSYKEYLSQKGVFATGSIKSLAPYKEAKTIPYPELILRWLYAFRSRISKHIENTTSWPYSGLLQAILLGERHKVPNQIKELFSEAGTIHLLSISGFHLTILALAAFFCLRFLLLRLLPDRLIEMLSCLIRPSRLAALLSIPLIILYTALTGSRISTIRACIIVTLFFLSLLLERNKGFLRPLIIAGFCIVLWQPSSVLRLDFQLTFLASFGVIFMIEYLSDLKVPFPSPASFLRRLLIYFKRSLFLSWFLSLAAFLITSPLTAYYFNIICPGGIFTNLAAALLVLGILYTGLGAMVILPLCPGLAGLLFQTGAFLAGLLIRLNSSAVRIPLSFFYLPSPSKVHVFIIYVCIFISAFLLRHWMRNSSLERRIRYLIPFLSFLLVLLFVLLPRSSRPIPPKMLTVTFLDVGRGDACVIQTPSGRHILIDGGGSYNHNEFDVGHRIIAPYLWHEKIDTLDLVVLSHPHPDHLNGLLFILKNFTIGRVWKTMNRSASREYRLFEDISRRKRIPVRTVARGERAALDGVLIEVMADGNLPDQPINSKATYKEENNCSLVLKLSYRHISFLFTGDIQSKAEGRLLTLGEKLQSTVLKVPHHGSRYSSTLPFLHRVSPKAAVFSGRNYGRQRFPHPITLNRYRSLPCEIYRTDRDGAVRVETDGAGFTVTPYVKMD